MSENRNVNPSRARSNARSSVCRRWKSPGHVIASDRCLCRNRLTFLPCPETHNRVGADKSKAAKWLVVVVQWWMNELELEQVDPDALDLRPTEEAGHGGIDGTQ